MNLYSSLLNCWGILSWQLTHWMFWGRNHFHSLQLLGSREYILACCSSKFWTLPRSFFSPLDGMALYLWQNSTIGYGITVLIIITMGSIQLCREGGYMRQPVCMDLGWLEEFLILTGHNSNGLLGLVEFHIIQSQLIWFWIESMICILDKDLSFETRNWKYEDLFLRQKFDQVLCDWCKLNRPRAIAL